MEILRPDMVQAKREGNTFYVKRAGEDWQEYDPTFDITLHCRDKVDMDSTLDDMQEAFELLKKYRVGKVGHVKKARWMIEGRILCCSRCDWNSMEEHNYCPNCGSHMR